MNGSWSTFHAGLQSVLDTAFDAVIVIDEDDRVIGWNQIAETTFGFAADHAMGRRLGELIIPQRYRAAHYSGMKHYLATGEGPVLNNRIEIEALHSDGREIPVELSIAASDQFGGRLFIGFLRDISERRALAERQQRILQESEHRVRNMLTVVSAIAQQTARGATDMESFNEAFTGRLDSLAKAHELLTGKVWHDVALTALVERVLGGDVTAGRACFVGSEVLLKPGQVLGLSMILHELYTNAVKYGALCSDEGQVSIEWRVDESTVEFVWSETGTPCPPKRRGSGFGQRMIAMSVKSDLGGTIERNWRPDGLTAVLRFPVEP